MLEEIEGWVEGAEGSDVGVQEVEGGDGRAEGGSREEWTTKGGGVRKAPSLQQHAAAQLKVEVQVCIGYRIVMDWFEARLMMVSDLDHTMAQLREVTLQEENAVYERAISCE
ncbi:hypothetical protein ACFX2G_035432 [Malus domestica]